MMIPRKSQVSRPAFAGNLVNPIEACFAGAAFSTAPAFYYFSVPQPQPQPPHWPEQLPPSGQPMHFLPFFLAL